ncbi:hypothetical protein ISN75_03185 [Dyella marensis]|uniref:zinc-dependent metalloprotease family protein n=1 Tax=Dyella marensis TaxID=500610 RepID=UPI0031D859CE
MKIRRTSLLLIPALLISTACLAITATTSLTPSNIPDGQLPSGYAGILFNFTQGEQPYILKLPQNPKDQDWVLFGTDGSSRYTVHSEKLDLPRNSVAIWACGAFCQFRYEKKTGLWSVTGTKVKYYSSERSSIPAGNGPYTVYDIKPGDSHPRISLPATAVAGSIIYIRSSSQLSSRINPDDLLHASTATIENGDAYMLRYVADFKKWAIEKSPERLIDLKSPDARTKAPRSVFTLTDDGWIPNIKLPAGAGDRDRITIRSSTARNALIEGGGVEEKGMFGLSRGQEYTFMYIAEKKRWVVMDAPDTIYTAANLRKGVMPDPATPRTIYVSDRASYVPNIQLPQGPQKKGARILFRGEASNPFNVLLASDGSSTPHSVGIGETPAFVSDGQKWMPEAVTIDVLAVYSSAAASTYGEEYMRSRLLSGILATNQALENSGATFTMRLVGFRRINAPAAWKDLSAVSQLIGSHPQVAKWRDNLKADLVYYEGTEKQEGSCGVAYAVGPSEKSFAAAGSTHCSTSVMRHELGHLLGIYDDTPPWAYGRSGYPLVGTIMAGNKVAFYSTPHRYTRDYGLPMGMKDRYDAMDAMNEFSPYVSGYR